MVILSKLEKAIQKSWSRETSYYQESWNKTNPASGQCAVTALVISDYLGGQIIWSWVKLPNGGKTRHYFNMINGRKIDITKQQFFNYKNISKNSKPVFDDKLVIRDKRGLLANTEVRKRYNILKTRVEKYL